MRKRDGFMHVVDFAASWLCSGPPLCCSSTYIHTYSYAFTCIWQLPPPLLLPLTSWWVRFDLAWYDLVWLGLASHGISSRKRHMCRHCDYLLLFLLCVCACLFLLLHMIVAVAAFFESLHNFYALLYLLGFSFALFAYF